MRTFKCKLFAALSRVTLLVGCGLLSSQAATIETNTLPATNERKLIQVLKSNASPDQKAITCKYLAIYGTSEAVPVLAPLLSDERLASWARIALEAIPGSAPDKAFRDSLPKLHDKLLIGVINSMGVRRDGKAVGLLAKKLNETDADVASAAAESLGRIGGSRAARVLRAQLAKGRASAPPAVAEACVRCAERFMAEGDYSQAVKLYDFIREAGVRQQTMIEATRGAILARKSGGLPLLLEQLRSTEKARWEIGLQTARELPGTNVTAALAAEMSRSTPEHQPLLLLALAERNDPSALPAILQAARSGLKKVRLVAVGVLDRSGNPAALPVLLEVASGNDSELAQAAKSALGRLPGSGVDKEIMDRLSNADTRMRPVLLDIAGRRAMEQALPMLLKYADSDDPRTRVAALNAIGTMGTKREVAALVKLLQAQQSADKRADTEKAVLAISSRQAESCTPILLPLAQSSDTGLRLVALRALAAAGGPAALDAVRVATEDNDDTVRDEAVQTLVSWPNTWPEDSKVADPLLALAKSAQKPEHQVLALRGFLQFLLGDEKLKPDEKLRRVNEALPLLNRPEDKRLAIAVIRQISKPDALELLANFAGEEAVAEDACSAIVDVAGQGKSKLPKTSRQQALQTAVEKSPNDTLKQKAQQALDKLNDAQAATK